jgi:hypothetical protein
MPDRSDDRILSLAVMSITLSLLPEFPTLPHAGLARGIATVNLALIAAGVGLVVFGARRLNALPDPRHGS